MGTTATLIKTVPNKSAIGKVLLRTGIAKLALVDAPVLVARGALTIPNKSGLARLYLKRRMAGNGLVRAAVLTLPAAAVGVGIGIGYLTTRSRDAA